MAECEGRLNDLHIYASVFIGVGTEGDVSPTVSRQAFEGKQICVFGL